MRNKKGQFVKGNKSVKYWLGKHRSEETKNKLKKVNTKNPVNYWKGRRFITTKSILYEIEDGKKKELLKI